MNTYDFVISTNPASVAWVKDSLRQTVIKTGENKFHLSYTLQEDGSLPIWAQIWKFPSEALWEYDEGDTDWCQYFGYGNFADDKTRRFYVRTRC